MQEEAFAVLDAPSDPVLWVIPYVIHVSNLREQRVVFFEGLSYTDPPLHVITAGRACAFVIWLPTMDLPVDMSGVFPVARKISMTKTNCKRQWNFCLQRLQIWITLRLERLHAVEQGLARWKGAKNLSFSCHIQLESKCVFSCSGVAFTEQVQTVTCARLDSGLKMKSFFMKVARLWVESWNAPSSCKFTLASKTVSLLNLLLFPLSFVRAWWSSRDPFPS